MTDLLEKFKKVVEVGNVTKASKELNVSQPALTMSLNKLESQLGTYLLIRSKKGVYPTETGLIVYKYSKKIQTDIVNLTKEIDNFKEVKSEQISCGMIDHVADFYLDQALATLKDSVKVNFHINNSSSLISLVDKGEIDFAFVTKPNDAKKFKSLEFVDVFKDQFGLYICKENKTAIDELKYITYNPESNTYKMIDQGLRECGIKPEYSYYSTSPVLNLKLCEQCRGIAILPKVFIENSNSKVIKELKIEGVDISRSIALVTNNRVYLSKETKNFINSINLL